MKKGQEPGQLDKEAVGRITCRILQEEEPGGMLVKKLWRLAGMLICLLCLTGGLCSAFLSGFGIRYLVPVFWILLIVSVLFWIGFSRLPLEGVYRILAILGTLIGVSLLLLLLQRDVIAGYMSAVNGVRIRLNEAYDGTLALYQASASAMQMTVFFGFILFLLTGLLSAGICYRTNPAVVLAGEFPVLAGIGIAGGTPSFFSFFLILLGTLGMLSAAAVSRADQRDQDSARQARQMTEQMKSSVNVWLLLQAVVLSLLAFVLVRPLTNTLLQAQEAGMKTQNGVLQAVWQLLPAVSGGRLKLSVEGVGGGVSDGTLTDQDGFYFGKVQALKVTVSEKPSETVYLKGFIGTDYTGTAFEEADGESFVQAASLWKLDGNVSLGVENLPFLRTYYAENVVFTGEGDDAKPELAANAASSAVTLQVENLAANPNYTYVPYGAFLNDYYQVLGGDGALAGQSVQQDIFSCYPRKQLEEVLEDWNETKQQESTLDQAESAYAAYVQAHCSSLPENLSYLQEKFDLELETKESADPKEAEKNWEKIKTAVVSELAGNYEFVREPEAVPEGKDFVEWFLKESKEGNSVHFAAAATMLLRACGMPARYVVGYAAPASLFKGQEDGSYQAVLEDDNAHAWAEVYREGIGWTVVEATPGFAALVTESDGASGQKEKEADSPDTPGEAFYQEDTPEAETPGIGSRIFRVVKKALAAVALTIAACGIAAVIRRHILCKRRRRGRKGETLGEQIQRIYRSFAALQKFNKKSVCSCQEERFAKQLGKKYPVFSEKTAQKLANIVLKACYSDQGLTKKECQFVLDCYEKLAEAVSKELSPAKRLVGSLIFCFW